MKSDQELAENIQKLISNRTDSNDSYISLSSEVVDGIRYITFTAMSNATFQESYTLLTMISDMLGLDDRESPSSKYKWANPHFKMDFEAIEPYMMREINKDDRLPIVLSGHGVAGSIAVIAGYYLVMKGLNIQRVVTFGALSPLNYNKKNDWVFEVMLQITKQHVLKNDPMPKYFRWSTYCSVNRIVLDMVGVTCGIYDYVDAMSVGDGGLL